MAPLPSDNSLWTKYVSDSGSGTATAASASISGTNRSWFELYCNGRVLKYATAVYGDRPSTGYPLYIGFCGGGTDGGAVPNSNDSSWWGVFDSFYGTPVAKKSPCVFVACRGISAYAWGTVDTYDLHSQPESFVLLQRMIMNLLLPKPLESQGKAASGATASFVDPNKVFMLGFSAGGNGIYQLAPRISDRCAAVVAGGGHPEQAQFQNVANLPLLQQCGEIDQYEFPAGTKIARAPFIITVNTTLNTLQTTYGTTLYNHRTDIIQNGDHNTWAQPGSVDQAQPVLSSLSNLGTWSTSGYSGTSGKPAASNIVINPENWVAPFVRVPTPQTVVWNLAMRPPSLNPAPVVTLPYTIPSGKAIPFQDKTLFYWLYIRDSTSSDYHADDIIRASYGKDSSSNWIKVEKPVKYLGFLLNADMVDFSKLLNFFDWNNNKLATISSLGAESATLQDQTLRARGDPSMVFSKMVYLDGSSGSWTGKTADTLVVPSTSGTPKAML